MKAYPIIKKIILLMLSLGVASALAATGDKKELGFVERFSVTQILEQQGHPDLVCVKGTKLEGTKGYALFTNCVRKKQIFVVTLFVAFDWKEVKIVSIDPIK